MAKATVNPFAAAASTAKKQGTTKDRPVFIASEMIGENDKVVFTAQEVSEAIVNYNEGHTLFEQGKAIKDATRPVIESWTAFNFAKDWIRRGTRPENPALMSAPVGGASLKVAYFDSIKKLDEDQFTQLASVIGEKNAEDNVTRRHEFAINSDVLDQDVKVSKNGKVVTQNVMEALTEALQEKFGPSPDILAALFVATEKFHTNKGLIDKALQLVKPNPYRIMDFLDASRVTVQIKTGADARED